MGQSRTTSTMSGFTLIEVLVSVVLLAVAFIPVLHAHIGAQVIGTKTERVAQSQNFAIKQVEEIRARALSSYSTNFSAIAQVISGLYLYTVTDDLGPTLKTIQVTVWHDANNNQAKDNNEMEAVLDTKVANRQ